MFDNFFGKKEKPPVSPFRRQLMEIGLTGDRLENAIAEKQLEYARLRMKMGVIGKNALRYAEHTDSSGSGFNQDFSLLEQQIKDIKDALAGEIPSEEELAEIAKEVAGKN